MGNPIGGVDPGTRPCSGLARAIGNAGDSNAPVDTLRVHPDQFEPGGDDTLGSDADSRDAHGIRPGESAPRDADRSAVSAAVSAAARADADATARGAAGPCGRWAGYRSAVRVDPFWPPVARRQPPEWASTAGEPPRRVGRACGPLECTPVGIPGSGRDFTGSDVIGPGANTRRAIEADALRSGDRPPRGGAAGTPAGACVR